jgi:hypothetical protein
MGSEMENAGGDSDNQQDINLSNAARWSLSHPMSLEIFTHGALLGLCEAVLSSDEG